MLKWRVTYEDASDGARGFIIVQAQNAMHASELAKAAHAVITLHILRVEQVA